MRRALAIGALVAAVVVLVLAVGRGGDGGDAYLVRAEFRNAFTVTEGEDVKIAGVTVGRIKALDLTERAHKLTPRSSEGVTRAAGTSRPRARGSWPGARSPASRRPTRRTG